MNTLINDFLSMKKDSSIILFQQNQVRRHWDEEKEFWYFSIVDVVKVLTGSQRPRKYCNDLKKKLSLEGNQLSEMIGQLKMQIGESVISFKNAKQLQLNEEGLLKEDK